MTLPEEHRMPSPSLESGEASAPADDSKHQWDINDTNLPVVREHEAFQAWPDSHCKHIYPEECEEARRHSSGWAMRNTNNHNVSILKKSCLGVLVCTARCTLDNGGSVRLRPAICDKARKKQLGKPCPNPRCQGRLEIQPCRGHCGYPVTHFWRHVNGYIFFQAKGVHDHPKPEAKNSTETRRHPYKDSRVSLFDRRSRKRSLYNSHISYTPAKVQHIQPTGSLPSLVISPVKAPVCSCPPFECTCRVMAGHPLSQQPSQSLYTATANNGNNHAVNNNNNNHNNNAAACLYNGHGAAIEQKSAFVDINEFHFSPEWKESYNEYFDFGVTSPAYDVYKNADPTYGYQTNVGVGVGGIKGYMEDFANGAFPGSQPSSCMANCAPSKMETVGVGGGGGDCLYGDGQMALNGMTQEALNVSSADSGIMSLGSSHSSPSAGSADAGRLAGVGDQTLIDDFDLSHPANILSLDQPLGKREDGDGSLKETKRSLTSSLMTALLPSITAFLDEDQTKQQGPPNGDHFGQALFSSAVSAAAGLTSPAPTSRPAAGVRPGTPYKDSPSHCLTELQPVGGGGTACAKHAGSCAARYGDQPGQYAAEQSLVQLYDALLDKDHILPQTTYQDTLAHGDFESFSFYNDDIYDAACPMASLVN